MALHRLVRDCPPLDPNSSYCNLLQCSHFKSTSIAAIHRDALVGSVTAYRPPGQPDTLFVWQVAVHSSMRGQGLAREMLRRLFARMATEGVRFIETSITADNEASQRLFAGFAAEHKAEMLRSVMFDKAMHFEGAHDTEYLYRIGPVESAADSFSTEQGETP
jgi:L-2,4-diaminobutyric acid acetyltransferase